MEVHMAFTIIVKNISDCLFNLLRNRLALTFTDAYIIQESSDNLKEDVEMSEFTTCIYDNSKTSENGDIPLYTQNSDGVFYINCSSIVTQIKKLREGSNSTIEEGIDKQKMHLLISHAYIEEREKCIKEDFSFIKETSEFPIRIDLMSGIRMTSVNSAMNTGSLTSLIHDASSKKFKSKRILEYLNPEINGYLTPGKPDNHDDVFEAGIDSIKKFTHHLNILTYSEDIDIKSLVVIEGFRIKEIKEIIHDFDTIHILLPSRMCDESIGMKSTINEIKILLNSNQKLLIHFSEKANMEMKNETIRVN